MSQSCRRLPSASGNKLFPRTMNRLLFGDGNQFFVRAAVDLASGQKQKEHTEHKIKTCKTDQVENRVAAADHFAIAVPRVKEP
jgi:hypothetical protein